MENNNSDWMAVQTQVGDASFADIYNLGVDPSAVTLDTKSTYKEKKKIKENPVFQTNGKFDDKKFDQYYDMSVKTLNAYKQSDFSVGSGNIPDMNLWEDTSLARALKQKTFKDPISIKTNVDPERNLKIAQKSNLGFVDLNQWSDPQKSIAEVAQGQKVLDGKTGKELDFTPEDNGIGNAFGFFDEPLVISAYDDDVTDADGKVIHKRGETKFDAKGLPRYETLAGRNASGKQIMSRLDTLTKEDSYINKFDFMDSDDLNKSIGGSVMKTAVNLLPFALGGPLATAAKAYFIADGLVQAGTEISKALMGIMGGPDADKSAFYKSLNNVQAFTKQWKGGTSEYAKNNFVSMENVLNLASDSVYQLMGQQALSMWPQRIKQYQLAKELNLNPNLLQALTKGGDEATAGVLKFQNYVAKYGDDAGAAVVAMSKNIKAIENMGKYASHGARAFMAATSAVGISEVADQAGLDARDKGLLYLGLTAGLTPLFAANIGHFVEGGHEIDELATGVNGAIKKYAAEYLSPVAKAAESEVATGATEALTGLAKMKASSLDFLKAGRDLGARVAKRFDNINTPILAGIAEGVEEVSEEALQDGVKAIYNGLSDMGLTSTKDKKFDFSMEDVMSRYGQAFVGGAVGGMIFKLVDSDIKIPTFMSEDMKEYVANGYGDKVIEQIKDLHSNGQLGSKELSINKHADENGILEGDIWAPVNKDNPVSQNDFIADRMIREVKANMAHLNAFGLDNPDFITEGKNKFYDAIVDTRTDTDLRDRLRGASDKLVQLNSELKDIDDTDINAEIIKKKKEEIKLAKEDFDYLSSDESVDEYFRQGLFNINTEINSKFGVKTRESFTKELIGSKNTYALLKDEDKAKVDAAFNDYRASNNDTFGIKVDLRNARLQMEAFDNDMKEHGGYEAIENYNESLKTLSDYAVAGKGLVDGKETENTLIDLAEDFYENMKDVKYIPDFLHDEINKRLENLKQNGLSNGIKALAVQKGITMDIDTFRQLLLDGNINNLNQHTPMQSLFKAYLGKFKPITIYDSPTYTKANADGKEASLSSLIKVINEVDGIEDNSEEKNLYEIRKQVIDSLTPEQAQKMLATAPGELQYNQDAQENMEAFFPQFFTGENDLDDNSKGEILNLLNDVDYESILDDADDLEQQNGVTALKFLHNINKQLFLSQATGQSAVYDYNTLTTAKDNVLINHVIDNSLNNQEIGLSVQEYKTIDDTVDEIINKIESASRDKATSPLATFLADTYRFKTTEFENVFKNGASNYVNNSDDFEDALNDHIDKVEKVDAFMRGLVKLNPIINKWREDHKDIVPKELQDEILTTITPLGYGTIYQNASILLNELRYLKDLNDFNKNNTLAKLLREDGKQLSASHKTLQKISSIVEVADNLPSLVAFVNDAQIKEYIDDVDNATDEAKIEALGIAAKFEHQIFTEFQALNDGLKQSIIDLTFKPINSGSYTFRSAVNDDAPLNDMHQTLYLAKIFGSSSIDYTNAIAGEKDDNGYSKITAAKMDPFPAQESAIRLAYLSRYGDPQVYGSLTTAFAYKNQQEPPSTFRRDNINGIDVSSILTVIGDPGVGKTKAIMAGILSFDNDVEGDTILLGSVNEHVANLSQGIINAGFESRINGELTDNVKDFIQKLELSDANNRILSLDSNEDKITEALFRIKNYTADFQGDSKIEALLNNITNEVTKGVKLHENNGQFNELLSKKFKGIRNIIIDEFTHANPVDLAIITNVVNAYNKSVNNDPTRKITITLAGDNNQLGFSLKGASRTFGDFMSVPTSVPLTTSLRSGWDLINNPLIEVKDRTSQLNDMSNEQVQDPTVASRLRQIPIRINYTIANGSPIGIYREVSSGQTTSAQLQFFNRHIDAIKASANSMVYIVQDDSAIAAGEALMRDMLGADWKDYASVLTATNTQGREYKYAIVDAGPSTEGDSYKVRRGYKFLNTMLSRATEATLLIDKGDYDEFASWTQTEVPKAIDQKKLTDEMVGKIKENRQAIVSSILSQSVDESPEVVTNVAPTPVIEEENAEEAKVNEEPVVPQESEVEPVVPSESPIENKPIETMPGLSEEDVQALLTSNNPVSNVQDESEATSDFARTSPYMVHSYTSFTYKRDADAVKAVMGNVSDAEAEKQLLPLKELVTYKDFDRQYFNNSPLINTLQSKGYSLRGMELTVRALKRSPDFMTVGRSKWNSTYKEEVQQDLLIVEATIPNKLGNAPFTFTLGTFNSLDNIQRYGGDTDAVKSFLAQAREGLARNQEWVMPTKFSVSEWKAFAATKEFVLDFKEGVNNNFKDLKGNYSSNMTITNPMVIIAKDFNFGSLSNWQTLTGKSVSLATEHASLRAKSPVELYEIYAKQLSYFNTDEYKALDYAGKKAYEQSLPKIPGTSISPRPGLVKMIKLNNPKHNFVEFVTNYNIFEARREAAKANKQSLNLQQEVREFEMSPYVADRLIKSMMLLHRMLTDENSTTNREWFEANVLPKVQGNVLNQISSYITTTKAQAKLEGDNMDSFFDNLDVSKFVSSETDATALKSTDDLVEALDKYLYGNDKLVRGVYETQKTQGFKNTELKADVDLRAILPSQLTNEKWKDFQVNGVLNVRNLSIYNGLKPSFLKMVDESLKALGSLPITGDMSQYSLAQVFKNGEIESLVVAGVGSNGRNVNNVIAPAYNTSFTNKFMTNVASVQSASFYIDFNSMMSKMAELSDSGTLPVEERQKQADAERAATNKTFATILASNKITRDYNRYEELAAMSFANKAELEAFMEGGIQTSLRPDVKVTDINKAYYIDTAGENKTFADALLDEKLLTYDLTDNDTLVTLVAEYEDRVQTTTFAKQFGYSLTTTEVYKQTNEFNATDEAKRIIGQANLTKESVLEMASATVISDLALDITPIKGKEVDMIDASGNPIKAIITGASIGESGSIHDSFVTVKSVDTGLVNRGLMQSLPEEIINQLEVHPRAQAKAEEYYSRPENHDYWATLLHFMSNDIPLVQTKEITNAILEQLGITDKATDARDDKSVYLKMMDLIDQNAKSLIVNPWGDNIPEEYTPLIEAYNTLAEGVYTDNLHNANDFINNFSIFANGEWTQYQKTIDEMVANADPELAKNILKLEEQLNKLTHDC
jgi:hypothetical protein